jgi:hypothetical protein
MRTAILAAVLATIAGVARAEVTAEADAGFTTRNVVEVAARADKVFAALGQVGRWWNPAHSYSGKAENLTLELKPGGCFCEALPGGGVRHATVAMVMPPSTLRLDGALGPLQAEGVSGALTFELKPKGESVEVVQTYRVGGGAPGLSKAYAAIVDQVLAEQLTRFERYVETGRP